MIDNDIIIRLKGASMEERHRVRHIFEANYNRLLDELEKSDYCCSTGYWNDYTPTSKPIIEAKDFIRDYLNYET